MDTTHEIESAEQNLKEIHNRSVAVAAKLMRMAGAQAFLVDGISDDSVAFWTFSDTGEHATIDAAVQRIGAHPAVQKLVTDYRNLTKQMLGLERYIARMTARADRER